jgi:hypothetical protein
MQLFRQMACKQVEDGDHTTALVLSGGGNTFLYQAYLGRVQISANGTFDVFIDDEAIQTGTTGNLVGNTCCTWYDGISYASVGTGAVSVSEDKRPPSRFSLSQNYPNPFNASTVIKFYLPDVGTSRRGGIVSLKVYDPLGREIATLVNQELPAGSYEATFNTTNLASGVYFYRLNTLAPSGLQRAFSETRKMILLR